LALVVPVTSNQSRTAVRPFALPGLLALVFFSFHLPYLPASLEDLDSINFALGVRHFDVAEHQPHPPGYPVYIAAAKAVNAATGNEAVALGLLSVVSAALGVLAIAVLFRRLAPDGSDAWIVAATALAAAAPLYWFSAARPLSDAMGLAAALAVQAGALAAPGSLTFGAAAFCAGLAAGIRSQVVWLTVPLLIFRVVTDRSAPRVDHGGRGRLRRRLRRPAGASAEAGGEIQLDPASIRSSAGSPALIALQDSPSASSAVKNISLAVAYIGGVLVWAVPLVAMSGGPAAYVRALSRQGTEDLTGVRMVATSPTLSTLVNALYHSFVGPWAIWPVAVAVLLLAAAGAVSMARRTPHTAALVAAGFGPYLVFHLLFQESFTGRYALPLLVPVVFCAAAAAGRLPRRLGLALIAFIAMWCAHLGGTSVAAYSRAKAPAFRLLDDMRRAATSVSVPPVLAFDRREEFDLRRPIRWMGAAMPPIDRKLPAPPQHEWLEIVKYWNRGGRAPVWLVVDPMRNAIDLIGRGAGGADPVRYRWPVPYPVLLSGVRPNEMDWYQIVTPEWYVGEGWALTPEAAGISEVEHRGLSSGAIDGWIGAETLSGTLVVGGRNFDGTRPRLQVYIDGQLRDEVVIAPGFFLRFVPLDGPAAGRSDFAKVTIRTMPPSRTAIEQFDASSARPVFGYGQGWQEPEFNPQNGLRWRWLSERGELNVRAPAAASTLTLHLEGESPRKYFSRGSRLIVRAGGEPVFDSVLSLDFAADVPIAMRGGRRDVTITLETNQVFVPAERSWRRSADRRHLGLRMFKVGVTSGRR
jgi:hypothetical protein